MSELKLPTYRFCPSCGGAMDVRYHEGVDRPVCTVCNLPVYVNPAPATCQILIDCGRVLLTLRSVDPKKGMWCLPGGFIEWGEAPEDAARRELAEETGLAAERCGLVGIYSSIGGEDRHVLVIAYRVPVWNGTPVAGDDAADVRWFGLDELPELAFPVHRRALMDALRVRRCCG